MTCDCIECFIGELHVAIPADEIERIAEFDCAPRPPMARRWISGIGLHNELVYVLVALTENPRTISSRSGLVIKRRSEAFNWALEVDRVVGLVTLEDEDAGKDDTKFESLPVDWLKGAGTRVTGVNGALASGGRLCVLDVGAVKKFLELGPAHDSIGLAF